MKHKRVTCLLGAGASVEIGGPTTECMTKLVDSNWEKSNFGNVARALKGNFEEKFHILETLYSHTMSKRYVVNDFVDIKPEANNWNYIGLCNLLLSTVGDRINEYDNPDVHSSSGLWFGNFWKNLSEITALDIATLNYDTRVEQSLHTYEDGFSELLEVMGLKSHGAYRFHPEILNSTKETRVMHMHGCITYALGTTTELNKYAFDDSFHDLYKYYSYVAAREHWFGHSNPRAQDGLDIYAGPLITGLRKTDKILVNPYMSYEYEFHKVILNNSSLLIIGYSCGDIHINAKIMRMKQLHSNNRRVVVISYLPDYVRENWHPDSEIRNWPTANEYDVISHLMGCEVANKLNTLSPPGNFVLSDDGCVRWYLCGFKNAVEKYQNDIISFLLQ